MQSIDGSASTGGPSSTLWGIIGRPLNGTKDLAHDRPTLWRTLALPQVLEHVADEAGEVQMNGLLVMSEEGKRH